MMRGSEAAAVLARESERLMRRMVWIERAGDDRWRQISFLYRCADRFGRSVFEHSFCHHEIDLAVGCASGACCRCRPDVFAYEEEVLNLLPKRRDASGFCPFFNLSRKNCGIYGVRPFACRVYFNLASSAQACCNPNDLTLQLFSSLKPHLELILGPYRGGYDASLQDHLACKSSN